jgi:stalled ribosome rescue protein Dom34
LIRPADEVQTKIRTKDTTSMASKKSKKLISFMDALVTVETVVPDSESIHVIGTYHAGATGRRGKTSLWLIDGSEFMLRKKCWQQEDIQALSGGQAPTSAKSSFASQAGEEGRAMTEFRELLATDADLLTFGDRNVLYVLDHGAVKTLLITETAFSKLTKEKQMQIGNKSGKFRGADVLILKRTSEYHTEILTFGGVVAILKYRFNPEDCIM